jgi:peptidyl-prolyl cis-trans isomerase B (cyclophilin B)
VFRAHLVPVLALALLAAGCGGSSGGGATSAAATTEASGTTTTGVTAADGCADVAVPAARKAGGAAAPKDRLDPGKTYRLVVETNCGSFTITLDQASAPATTASLVSLAGSSFYNGTVFHRIVPGFVIQGGDPTRTGSGGPGYQTVDPPPADAHYVLGVVAMAKTAAEPAGTSGSQFFVVTGADVGLPPDYAVVGKVTSGLAVVERIGTFGDPADPSGTPTRPVVIASVRVEAK